MIAFSLSFTARSRIARSSAFCSPVFNPFLEGQSIFATVATQAARNSRTGLGGVIREGSYEAAWQTKAINGRRGRTRVRIRFTWCLMVQGQRPVNEAVKDGFVKCFRPSEGG